MSEPPALAHYTGGGDFQPRVSALRRADPPTAVAAVRAVPVVRAAEPPALVARVVARQQDPNLGLPTYKSQINGRSILKIEGNRSETQLSDSAAESIEEARKQQQAERTRLARPSPPAAVAAQTIKSSHPDHAPARAKAKEPPSNNVSSKKRQPAPSPTASPVPTKQVSAKKVTSPSSPAASPKPVKQGSAQKVNAPPANPVHEPAPASPIPPKAPPVQRPLNETWEFVTPQQERSSCCVII